MTTTPGEAARKLAQEYGVSVNGAKPVTGFNPVSVAAGLLDNGLRVAKGGGILHVYDPDAGVYRPGTEELRRLILNVLGEAWRPPRADAIITYLYDSAADLWSRPPMDKLNVANGILNLATGELEPRSADYLSPIQLGVAYDPDAECPLIRRFMEDVFPADAVTLGYEIVGWLCGPDSSFQQAIMLAGAGRNGKSTFLNMVRVVIGPLNVSHMSLHDLGSNRFAPAELYGKLANICPDIPAGRVASTSTFKAIVGGDPVTVERKYGHPFTFEPFARLAFSANEMPGSPDSTYAYRRRWIVIPFPNRFEGDRDDRNLLEKLTTPEELSGLFNVAIAAYLRMRERGSFSTSESTEEAAQEFKEAIDPVATYLREETIVSADAQVDRVALANDYEEWCRKKSNRPPPSRRQFYGRVREYVPTIEEKKVKGRRVLVGIGLLEG